MFLRRLYLQIYGTIIVSLLLVVCLSALLWFVSDPRPGERERNDFIGRIAHLLLPPADAPDHHQARALMRAARELDMGLALYDSRLRVVTAAFMRDVDPVLSDPEPGPKRWRKKLLWLLRLPDGRWLLAEHRRHRRHGQTLQLFFYLGCVALGVGLGAYPLVRRLTRRLEDLREGVERIGAGELTARVDVKGRDEVADLAASFNQAAGQIERLVEAHKLLLANASHELRTPLSRIRLGIDMLQEKDDEVRRRALKADIAELDELIDEILLMSRLDGAGHRNSSEEIDFVALVAEECARFEDCVLSGQAPLIQGDARLLRRLIRNLLQNAAVHGAPPVRVDLAAQAKTVTVTVQDGGPGIRPEDRENVVRPFFRGAGKQNVRGYGLGLALSKQIAESHGGLVEIAPPDLPPSAIRVTLPRPGLS